MAGTAGRIVVAANRLHACPLPNHACSLRVMNAWRALSWDRPSSTASNSVRATRSLAPGSALTTLYRSRHRQAASPPAPTTVLQTESSASRSCTQRFPRTGRPDDEGRAAEETVRRPPAAQDALTSVEAEVLDDPSLDIGVESGCGRWLVAIGHLHILTKCGTPQAMVSMSRLSALAHPGNLPGPGTRRGQPRCSQPSLHHVRARARACTARFISLLRLNRRCTSSTWGQRTGRGRVWRMSPPLPATACPPSAPVAGLDQRQTTPRRRWSPCTSPDGHCPQDGRTGPS